MSPILSNIYLHRLDDFVENTLIPEYTQGARRAPSPAYNRMYYAIRKARARGDHDAARELRKRLREMPSHDPFDPGYRRLRYIRYADDVLLGFIGPRAEAEQIKQRLAQFLRDDLALELSQEKTLITHARTGAAKFLGYEITVRHDDRKITAGGRAVNGGVGLRVPKHVVQAKCAPFLRRGKPAHRTPLLNYSDHKIVETFGAEYRGIVQYYLLAGDVWRLSRLRWVMETSLLKTLAAKHRSSVSTMAHRHKAVVETSHGPRKCLQVSVEREGRKPLVARFGGIPLRRQKLAVLHDRQPVLAVVRRKELIGRLIKGRCEVCRHSGAVEVHHVAKLADLTRPGRPTPAWAQLMARMRRKTLVVCVDCHGLIHTEPLMTANAKTPESCLR